MAKIAQLLPNRISGHLIFKWKTNSYCASLIIVSFCFVRLLNIERNLAHSALKASVVDDKA